MWLPAFLSAITCLDGVQAMNDYYVGKWKQVRHIEGASQRVQEDTMRFAGIVEGLGVAIVDSIMTLFAFPAGIDGAILEHNLSSVCWRDCKSIADGRYLLVFVRYGVFSSGRPETTRS
jgi:hypothetical protein